MRTTAGSKLADAILKGNDAIKKLVYAGEIEELRDIATTVPLVEDVEEPEEYLQDEGDIDYAKVPEIDLPPPLPSSKFAQNPELLKSLNRGGKRKFDQLIGWSDGGANDRTSKIHQPVFGGSMTEDSQSSDTDLRYGREHVNSPFMMNQDDDIRRMMNHENRAGHGRGDEDLRFNMSGGPGRPPTGHLTEFDMRNNYPDKDFRHAGFGQKSSIDSSGDHYSDRDRDRDRDGRSRWDDDSMIGSGGSGDAPGRNTFDKRDMLALGISNNVPHIGSGMTSGALSNHHNMQNINPNMPPPMPSMVPHPGMSGHPGMQSKNNPGMMAGGMMDGPIPHMMHHPNLGPPNFGPNGPPPSNSGPNFAPNFRPPNGNFGPNQHFRPMAPFASNAPPGPFNNNFPGPPGFHGPNTGNSGPPNFDRANFGPNFRGQNQMPGGPNGGSGSGFNNGGGFGNNFGGGGGGRNSGHDKNGPNRGMKRSSNYDDFDDRNNASGRNNYNNRGGRGRDGDQSRGSRLRDNY